jgi:hypothetical protein
VNDEPCQLYMLDLIAKHCNFEVLTAVNGFQALEIAQKAINF